MSKYDPPCDIEPQEMSDEQAEQASLEASCLPDEEDAPPSDPHCPECGAFLRKWNSPRGSRGGRNHSHYAKPQFYICPNTCDGRHREIERLWTLDKLDTQHNRCMAAREMAEAGR